MQFHSLPRIGNADSEICVENQQDNANYAAIKAQVEKDEKEKREAENERRASEGLPLCEYLVRVDVGTCRRLMGSSVAVKDGVWSKVKKGVQKLFMM